MKLGLIESNGRLGVVFYHASALGLVLIFMYIDSASS